MTGCELNYKHWLVVVHVHLREQNKGDRFLFEGELKRLEIDDSMPDLYTMSSDSKKASWNIHISLLESNVRGLRMTNFESPDITPATESSI